MTDIKNYCSCLCLLIKRGELYEFLRFFKEGLKSQQRWEVLIKFVVKYSENKPTQDNPLITS